MHPCINVLVGERSFSVEGGMGRTPRVEYAGAMYHVMCRGNRRETIFEDEQDCHLFLEALAEVCGRTGWNVCAYVLMPNHYHLVLQTPEANLVTGMKWFQGTYTKRHNLRHKQWGHLFQGRYKSIVIDPSDAVYFRTACNYVHLNPVRARLAGTADTLPLGEYRWSSSWYLLRHLSKTPEWLELGRIVEENTSQSDSLRARKLYMRYLEQQAELEDEVGYRALRRGWCLGSSEFKAELKEGICEQLSHLDRGSMVGEPRRMHDEAEAERLLLIAIGIAGLDLESRDSLSHNDRRKELIAWFLSRKTSVGQGWISKQLGMGDSSNVSRALKRVARTGDSEVEALKDRLFYSA